jgi:deoxyhypusine synthase
MLEKLRVDYLAAKQGSIEQIPVAVADETGEQAVATYPCGRVIPH